MDHNAAAAPAAININIIQSLVKLIIKCRYLSIQNFPALLKLIVMNTLKYLNA